MSSHFGKTPRSTLRIASAIARPAWAAFLLLLALAAFTTSPLRADETLLIGESAIPADAPLGVSATPRTTATRSFGALGSIGANIPLGSANEPVVAVDPNNPMHVAASSFFQLRVSTDGGVTFKPAVNAVLPAGMSSAGDASLGYDSQGRLFWCYLGRGGGLLDVILAQCDPTTGAVVAGYPVNVTAQAGMPSVRNHDKSWLAIDANPSSPHRDNLYIAWSQFTSEVIVWSTRSTNQGATWSPAVALSPLNGSEGFPWPVHNTVAPNGDVYTTYHATDFQDGTSGSVFICRSTDGGLTWPQKRLAYGAGAADVTFNTGGPSNIAGTRFWLQGSGQAYVLADPKIPGRVYVVANDDPNNIHGNGDDADVYIRTSTDFGNTWSASARVDHGPGTTFQVMPTAAIDPRTGCIAVHWYDNRSGATNSANRYLLDVYSTSSHDGGATWTPDIKVNDAAFDPDAGAPFRFTNVTRIGEYNGLATLDGLAHAVWCGNTFSGTTPVGQQMVYGKYSIDDVDPVVTCPQPLNVTSCTTLAASNPEIAAFLAGATVTDECDHAPHLVNDAPPSFAVGSSTTVTFTATDASGNQGSCSAVITVSKPDYTYTFPEDVQLTCDELPSVSGTGGATATGGATVSHTDAVTPANCTGKTGVDRTWVITDPCGVVAATDVQHITYVDHTPPVIHRVAETVALDCNPSAADIETALGTSSAADATDDCGTVTLIVSTSPVAASNCSRSESRTWYATDGCLNAATPVTRTVTWTVDTQPPTITATGTTLTLGCNPTAAQIEAALGTATATDDCGDVTPTHADAAPVRNACSVSQTRTWNAVDGCNHAAAPVSRKVTWTEDTSGPAITGVVASTPVLWPPNHTLRDITIDYTVADDCGGDITSVLSVTSNEPIDGTGDGDTSPDWIRVDPHHLKLRAERAGTGSGRVYTVTVSATNACGLTSTTTVPVVVAHNITNPTSGNCFKVGSAVNFAGTFWDVAGKRHTAQWTFDNLAAAGTVVEPSGLKAGSATGKYTFTDAGIYKVTLNLTDQNGAKTWVNTAGDLEAIAVVYDPSAGYAIGGGWFTSPAGAYRAVPALGGKVSYGFTSKYFKNATNPKGETQFEFKQAGLEFNALNFDYLVISGAKAQFKGQGKLNGDGAYGFMLTVLDGQIKGGGGTDLVRVKIWNKTTGAVVYDTQPGASDTADPTTAVGSGSTVAITTTNVSATPAGQVANDPGTEAAVPQAFAFAAGRPNPFRSATELRYALPEQARVEMGVYDVRGARVRVLVDGVEEAGERSVRFDAGPLEAGVYFVRMQATSVSDPARQFTKMQKVLMLR